MPCAPADVHDTVRPARREPGRVGLHIGQRARAARPTGARGHAQPRRPFVHPEAERGSAAQHLRGVGLAGQHHAAPRRDTRRTAGNPIREPARLPGGQPPERRQQYHVIPDDANRPDGRRCYWPWCCRELETLGDH
jgi:hypothetical protein